MNLLPDHEEMLSPPGRDIKKSSSRTLDQHMAKLRQKVEDDPADPRHILTVHGVGYRFRSKP